MSKTKKLGKRSAAKYTPNAGLRAVLTYETEGALSLYIGYRYIALKRAKALNRGNAEKFQKFTTILAHIASWIRFYDANELHLLAETEQVLVRDYLGTIACGTVPRLDLVFDGDVARVTLGGR